MRIGTTLCKKKESAFQEEVLQYLRTNVGGYWIKIHVSSYQSEGEPDIVGCYNGRFYAFELKTIVGKPSKLQEYKLGQIRGAGGTALVVNDLQQIKDLF